MRGLIAGPFGRAAAAVALLLWAATAWSAPRPPAELRAGAASIEVALPEGVPLGGYGGFPRRAWLPDLFNPHSVSFWFRRSVGVHDPFKVRSLVLESGSVRVLWLAVDLVGVDPTLVSALRQRLAGSGIGASAIIASASHTHSGPGAFGESEIFAFIAIDRLSLPVRDRILDGLERAARAADAVKAPARIAVGRSEVRDVAESRVQQPLDPELGVMRVTRTDGQPVALVWNYAIHGTALGRENFMLSNDLMGEASALLERQTGAPALFVNGAVGDVSPRRRGWPGVKEAGAALAEGALRAVERAAPEPGRLDVVAEPVALPGPMLTLRNCLNGWAPGWMALGLREVLPSSTEVLAVSVGRTAWVTIPGELETRLGLEVKSAARRRFDGAFIAGVSNDYLGYFLAAPDYRKPSYIACGSLYGERGGEVMRDAAIAALERAAAARDRR